MDTVSEYIDFSDNEAYNLTAFEGFCADLDKLENPILLVYEDLDRISDENKDQMAKLLQHNVKVIYEFDLKKMAALGYGYDYIEKYIPYTMNLTPVSGKKLIKKALAELDNVNEDLRSEDFAKEGQAVRIRSQQHGGIRAICG